MLGNTLAKINKRTPLEVRRLKSRNLLVWAVYTEYPNDILAFCSLHANIFFYKFRLKQKKLDLTTEATLNSPHGTQRQETLTGHLSITVGLHS